MSNPITLNDPERVARALLAAEALAMEMTGHTSNLAEAFKQWQAEREALVDFYEAMRNQDKLLEYLKKHWAVVHTLFLRQGVIGVNLTANKFEKVSESVRRLNEWLEEVEDQHKETQVVDKKYAGQLEFLSMIDNKKP
jgi:hypothetical protein